MGRRPPGGHLNLLGEYDFSEDKLGSGFGRNQAPKTDRLKQVPSWEFRNRRKSFTPRLLAKILWDFAYLCWANPTFKYPNEVGPGLYDIHSPRVPSVEEMTGLLKKALQVLPRKQVWVNPDCGLKTRGWPEVQESLTNMVIAARKTRTAD